MTLDEFRAAVGSQHRGYSKGYDDGWRDATEGRRLEIAKGENWSYRDGYLHGYEDGTDMKVLTNGRSV